MHASASGQLAGRGGLLLGLACGTTSQPVVKTIGVSLTGVMAR